MDAPFQVTINAEKTFFVSEERIRKGISRNVFECSAALSALKTLKHKCHDAFRRGEFPPTVYKGKYHGIKVSVSLVNRDYSALMRGMK